MHGRSPSSSRRTTRRTSSVVASTRCSRASRTEGARDRGRVQRLHRSDGGRRARVRQRRPRDRDPRASKTAALNLGDPSVSGFPRFYVDADVVTPARIGSADRRAPRRGRCLAASPVMDVDLQRSSLAVRAYYRVWERLPYVREGMIGVGVYALSEEGRRRFGEFPESSPTTGTSAAVRRERAHSCRGRAGPRLRTRASLRSHPHQDPKSARPVRAQAALPRPRRARADDEVLPRRHLDDRCSTVALARGDGLRRSSSSRLVVALDRAASPSTTTSGNAISRHVDPTGADGIRAEARTLPELSPDSGDHGPRSGRAWPMVIGRLFDLRR